MNCASTTISKLGRASDAIESLKSKTGCRWLTIRKFDDDDLTFSEGKEDELLGRLQKKLGKSKEDLRLTIEKL